MRFSLPVAIFVTVVLTGCATPQQKAARQQAKAEREQVKDDTRRVEQRRMMAVENGEIKSNGGRWAEVYIPNTHQTFDVNQATSAAQHGYKTGKAQTKDYYNDRQMHVDTFQTKDFSTKSDQAAQQQYATKDANLKTKFLNLFASKTAKTKAAEVKESPDANKVASTRALPDGKRQYLGPESKKLGQTINATDLANWRSGGGESVNYSDGTVEKMSTIKQLSIDDIRDLLNKSK